MNIAIQGHPNRGEEVKNILKMLTKNSINYCCDNPCIWYEVHGRCVIPITLKSTSYKYYTLEEFEEEFPFKIGDEVIILDYNNKKGIITNIVSCEPILSYFIKLESGNGIYKSAKALKSYKKVKEERNITLTLDKAKEWYNKGGELKEIALQAYTKEELNPLPKSWEEYCKRYKVHAMIFGPCISHKYVALWKLEQLRDCYRQGWKPKSKECAYAIKYADRGLNIYLYSSQEFLSFRTKEVAEEFLKNFDPLIKEAGDLI